MNQSLLARIETLEQAHNSLSLIHVRKEGNSLFVNADTEDEKRIYIPTPSGEEFHNDSKNNVRLIMGPYGSGKSTACCAEIVRRTMEMPVWCNGIRRSKWAIVRNTSGELETTTLQTWLHWFHNLGAHTKRKKPVMTYEHTFKDDKGVCEIELIFLALDREDDLRKIRSLEVTGVYVNEASEVPQGTISHFKGRINRYPSQQMCSSYWSGIIADTNPPDIDHWIYKTFEEEKPNGYRIFKQPSGLTKIRKDEIDPNVEHVATTSGYYTANLNADNYKNLKPDYYLRMAEGQIEEFIKVFCMGQYGTVILGKKVYPEYNDDFHSANDMQYAGGIPISLFWDYGLTPACLIVQFLPRGQLRIMKEFVALDMGIKQFAENIILPYLSSQLAGFDIEHSDGDPSGTTARDTDESTCMQILTGLGIETFGAATNQIIPRLEAVKYFLNRVIDGQAAILISREGCPVLRKGFLGDYHYKRVAVVGEARYQDKPNKNRASHPHDALQYCALRYGSAELVNKKEIDTLKLIQSVMNRPFNL